LLIRLLSEGNILGRFNLVFTLYSVPPLVMTLVNNQLMSAITFDEVGALEERD
jgi:hypothetical protein